jgi:acetyl esterase
VATAQITPLDRVQTVAAKGLMALPPKLQLLLAGGREKRVDGQQLDPQVQLMVALMNANDFQLRDPDHRVARERFAHDMAAIATKHPEVAWTREIDVAGAAGPLRARLYVPFGYRAPGAMLVYLHGGGWVVGDIDTHDVACRFLARHSGAAVVSVDYRLAPEHPFPAPVDDALAAFRDVVARADELGADPARIGIGGDSAGGHLSAVTSILAARDGGPAPALQVLIYPATDMNGWGAEPGDSRPSRELFAEGLLLEAADMEWARDLWVPDASDRRDERVSPLLAGELAGVAPAYIVTAGFDVLRDEGEAYAARLREAGVATTLRRQRGMVHGFIGAVGISSAAQRATAEIAGAIQVGLAPPTG